MSEIQFIKKGENKKYLIFDKEYHTSLTPDSAWYDLHYTEENIELKDMEFIETKSFIEMSCGNPVWGPAIDYGAAIGVNFILQGDKETSESRRFTYNHTTATFFKRIRIPKIKMCGDCYHWRTAECVKEDGLLFFRLKDNPGICKEFLCKKAEHLKQRVKNRFELMIL